MLPWEHAAVAYLLYTGYVRWQDGTPPAGWAVLVVLVASQLPDLLDKPLAWQFGLVPSGRSVAHSVFIAVPLAVVMFTLARCHGKSSLGIAFEIGHLSHLVTDTVPMDPSEPLSRASILWPLVTHRASFETTGGSSGAAAAGEAPSGVLEQTGELLLDAYPSLVALEPTAPDLIGLGLVVIAGCVWLADGRPGGRELWYVLRWPITAIRS